MPDTLRSDIILTWRVAALCGVLWGCALAGLERSVELGEWSGIEHFANALLGLLGIWCVTGFGWAALSKLAEPDGTRIGLVVIWLVGSLFFTTVQIALFWVPYLNIFDEIRNFPLDGLFSHILWTNGFYGGLYLVGYTTFSRSLRSRRHVSRLHRVLSEESALLSEARLRTMQSQLQPQVLVEALATAKTRYGHCPVAADQLVDHLISFLRTASTVSSARLPTLNNELQLAAAYVRLQAAIKEPLSTWTAKTNAAVPKLPFPQRVLVPVIEELGRKALSVELSSGHRFNRFYVQVKATHPTDFPQMPLRVASAIDKDRAHDGAALAWTFSTSQIDHGLTWTATAAKPPPGH
jgi:Histidine kinase